LFMVCQTMVPRTRSVFNASTAYRPDIDGLRAVAVSVVLIYHAFPTFLPGGFIGVDVFFVISGYLITRLVTVELRAGTFSLRAFYERRVRRIVPPLLLVLVLCATFGWIIMTPIELQVLGSTIGWSASFLANAFFAASNGYFENASYSSPLLHLWSLGVEEQFYLIWPILLIAAVRRGVTARVLGAIIGTSLAISIWGAWDSPDIHFYRLSCRAWELAAGGLLALQFQQPVGRLLAHVMSLGGLLLIVGGSVLLSAEMAFPGGWAVIPAVGALLLIAAGPQAWINAAVLSSPPLIFVGLISYSLYLWHWPLLAFIRIVAGHSPAPTTAAAALAVAFMAACLTYYVVERPVRYGERGSGTVPMLLVGLAALAFVGVAMDLGWVRARLSGAGFVALDEATQDWGYPGGFNFHRQSGFDTWRVGARRAQRVLFIGDSHMEQYWSRVTQVVAAHPGTARSAEFATYSGCPPLPGVNVRLSGVSCNRFFDYALARAWQRDVDTVVFGAYWESYLLGKFGTDRAPRHIYSVSDPLRRSLQLGSADTQAVLDEFQRDILRLVSSGRRVIIVLSNPTSPRFDPRYMIPPGARLAFPAPQAFDAGVRAQSVDVRPYRLFAAPVVQKLRMLAAASGAEIVDPGDTLCDSMACATTAADGRPLYRDANHLRPFFARERAIFLDEMLLQ
jgi:peptidoglycan/LPS O-acetylase OafA/YrhL